MESFHVESSPFIQNLKAFIISDAWQQVSMYYRHMESLGSFQYFHISNAKQLSSAHVSVVKS